MAASLLAATVKALSNTALILDDIPATAGGLIEAQTKDSHPDAHHSELPTPHPKTGKHMSEGEFYLKAAGASLVPKLLIGTSLGAAAGVLSFIGGAGVLTMGLVPLALWICGKGAEKEHEDGGEENAEYKPSLIDKIIKKAPGTERFLNRLTPDHHRLLGQTIKMDVVLEMEMMLLAAVALGASGLATAGAVGFAATIGLVPVVAVAATAIVWSTAFGVRKLRSSIAKSQRDIASGQRPKKPFDKVLGLIDRGIEPALGLAGKVALLAIGGGLMIEHAIMPLAQLALPHLSAAVAPAVEGALHAFESLSGIAQLAISTPLGFAIGKFLYNPVMGAAGRIGSVFKRNKKKEKSQAEVAPVAAPSTEPAPTGKAPLPGELRSSFEGNKKTATSSRNAPQSVPPAPKPVI